MEIIRVMDGKYAEIELSDGKRVFISILNDRVTASRMFCFVPFKKIWEFVFPCQVKTTFYSCDNSIVILKTILSAIDEVKGLEELHDCLENQVKIALTKWLVSPDTLSLSCNKKAGCKERISIKDFSRQHFLPIIEKMVESETNLLQEDINKNNPPIPFNEDQTRFEVFLLFLHLSGRPLSLIQGFTYHDSEVVLTFPLVIDEILTEKFAHINLNPQWLDKERGLTDASNYYKNKTHAYHKPELLYHKNKITEADLHRKISEIFFSLNADKIDNSLITAIGEIHQGGLTYLFQKLSGFAEKYEIVSGKTKAGEVKKIKTPEGQQEAKPFDCGLDPDEYEGFIKAVDEMRLSFTDRINKLEKIYAGEVEIVRVPEEEQETKPFDCGLDPDEYDEGLIEAFNKMDQSFTDRIKKMKKVNTEEIEFIKTSEEQQDVTSFDCGLDTDEYEYEIVAILNKMGADFQAQIEKLEKNN